MFNNYFEKINIAPFGSVLFETSKKAKYINISIKSSDTIRVAIPIGVSLQEANNFFNTKRYWVEKSIKKIEDKIDYIKSDKPVDFDYGRSFLINRLDELARKNNFIYNKVIIRKQRTRWGSCSMKNNISLNIQLINLPNSLIDYVIIHELVHTRVKNHSLLFWSEMIKYLTNAKILDKQLKKYYLK